VVSWGAGTGTVVDQTTTFTKTTGSVTDTLFLIVPQQGGVDLTYTRFLGYDHDDTGTASDLHYKTAYGVLTYPADRPTTGTATYTTTVIGNATRGSTNYLLNGSSTGTFSADFANNKITTTIDIKGKDSDVSPVTDFGTVSGTGTIASGGPAFTGTLTGAGSTTGALGGAFFGPQAAEFGYAWYFNGTDFAADGYAAGKKNP
jgi:hypothetical protein